MPQKSGRKGLQPGQTIQQTTSFAGIHDPDIEILPMPFFRRYPRFMGKNFEGYVIRRYLGKLAFRTEGPESFVVFDYIAARGAASNIRHFNSEKEAIDGYFDRVKSPRGGDASESEETAKKFFDQIYQMLS